MNILRVYTSGPIDETDDAEARDWRQYVEKWFADRGSFVEVLSPLRAKDSSIKRADYTPAELWTRDLADIQRADVVLIRYRARADYLTWGTPGEAALAKFLGKAVIFVTDDPRILNHPWAQYEAVRFFPLAALDAALEYILKFWRTR